jgi:hypothetical protein
VININREEVIGVATFGLTKRDRQNFAVSCNQVATLINKVYAKNGGKPISESNLTSEEELFAKGIDLFRKGENDQAIYYFDRAIELAPQDADAWYYKGNALNALGRHDEAINAYDQAIGIDPKYADALYNKGSVSKRFAPSNYVGDYGDIQLDTSWRDNPHSGPECIKIIYSAARSNGAGWAGINWVYPANNYGGMHGLQDVFTGARRLTFWARGLNGGETSEFKMGGIAGRYSDSVRPAISTGVITLSKEWKPYAIDLTGKNLTHVICGFCWTTDAMSNPSGCTIYLDDIRYEWL